MPKNSYLEKLKDPRWQKRRLEILRASEFTCQICDSKTKTLQIHHKYYKKNANPWEYPDAALICVCEKCHETAASAERSLLESISGDEYYLLDGFTQALRDLFHYSGGLDLATQLIRYEVTRDMDYQKIIQDAYRRGRESGLAFAKKSATKE